MNRGNFEELIKAKFDQAKQRAPASIWKGIYATLNEQTVENYKSSLLRYKWLSIAAILAVFISLGLHINVQFGNKTNQTSYNALLPTSSDRFHFFEPVFEMVNPTKKFRARPTIIFTTPKKFSLGKQMADPVTHEEFSPIQELTIPSKRYPQPKLAVVPKQWKMNTYMVPQYPSIPSDKAPDKATFWAGLEAGAGHFNPSYSGVTPISAKADFETIANRLEQNLVNPSYTTVQDGMKNGTMTSMGVDLGLKIGKTNRWSLESGILYTSVNNTALVGLSITDTYDDETTPGSRKTQITNNIEQSVNLENQMRFTSIPLKAGYYVMDKKLSLRINAGFTANYFLNSRLTDPTGQLQNTTENHLYNTWSLDGLTGFEVGYYMLDYLSVTIEPNYIQSLTPLSQSLISRNGFIVQTGIQYTLR